MGFSAKKAAKSIDKALAGLDSQIKAGNAARAAQADADMADIRKDMAAKTAARVASKAAPQKQSFAEAFRAARKDKGAGSTFTWQGKSYSTNMAGEGKAPSRPAARPVAKSDKAAPAARTEAKSDKATPAPRPEVKQQAPVRSSTLDGPNPFKDTPAARAGRANSPGILSRISSAISGEVERSRANAAATRAAMAKRNAPAEPKPDVWAPGAKPSGGRLLLKDNDYKKGGAAKQPVKKFAKGGSVDGIAKRGKTRAPLRKK